MASVFIDSVSAGEHVAISEGRLVVTLVYLGAKPSGSASEIVAYPLSGGGPQPIAGTKTSGGTVATSVATGPDGLYVTTADGSDPRRNEVYRLAGGVRSTIAGGPGAPDSLAAGNGDGGPAVAAPLQGPVAVAFGKNGELFIAEYGNYRVRRVDAAGIISTFAGNATVCRFGLEPPSPGPATATSLCGPPRFLGLGAAGDLYIAVQTYSWIDVVEPNGQLRVFASGLNTNAMHVGHSGELLVGDSTGRLLRLDGQGRSTVIASGLGEIADFAPAADGSIYVLHWPEPHTTARVNRVTKLSPA